MKQQYDSYKPSGIDWIGDIPSHWNIQRLKFGMNLINGRAYLQPELLSEGKYRILRVGNFFTNDSWYYSDMELEDNKYCSKGDLLYAWSASIGPYIWNEEKVIFHYHIWKVDLSGKMDKKYSYYLLDVITKVKLNDMHGSAMQHLTMENMNNSDIIVPPLAEQEAIAAWLDEKCEEIDAAIAKVDREIELIDELKQSEISRVVTRGLNPDAPLRSSGVDWIGDIPEHWEIVPLKHLVSYNDDVLSENIDKNHLINYVEIGDVCQSDGITNYTEYTFKEAPSRARRITKKGDVIISTVRTYLKAIAKVKQDNLIVSTGFMVLRARSIDSNYLSFSLLNESFIQEIISKSTGVSYPAINSTDIANIRILVPPLSEQQAIADYLDKKCAEIDGLKVKLTKKRETLKELRQSVISEVVTGKRKII